MNDPRPQKAPARPASSARSRTAVVAIAAALGAVLVAAVLRTCFPELGTRDERAVPASPRPDAGDPGASWAGAPDAAIAPPHVAPVPTYVPPPKFIVPAAPQPLPPSKPAN